MENPDSRVQRDSFKVFKESVSRVFLLKDGDNDLMGSFIDHKEERCKVWCGLVVSVPATSSARPDSGSNLGPGGGRSLCEYWTIKVLQKH